MTEEGIDSKWFLYEVHPMLYSGPSSEILVLYTKKKNIQLKNTQTMISTSSNFNILLILLVVATLFIIHDTNISDGVFASSLPPTLPSNVDESKTREETCDKSRTILTENHGLISSGPEFSNYTQNTHCEWLIRPSLPSQFKENSPRSNNQSNTFSSYDNSSNKYLGNFFYNYIYHHLNPCLKYHGKLIFSYI